MISTQMEKCNYYVLNDIEDSYGQATVPNQPSGVIDISIHTSSIMNQDGIKYNDCAFIGLTLDDAVTDKYIIEYQGSNLKVLYVIPDGRYTQVFMKQI